MFFFKCVADYATQAVVVVNRNIEVKGRLQQLFRCGQFAIHWSFIPLVINMGFNRGADSGIPKINCFRPTLGVKNYLVIWICKQSMDSNDMGDLRSSWDKRWDVVCTFTSWMAQGSYYTDLFMIDCITK